MCAGALSRSALFRSPLVRVDSGMRSVVSVPAPLRVLRVVELAEASLEYTSLSAHPAQAMSYIFAPPFLLTVFCLRHLYLTA